MRNLPGIAIGVALVAVTMLSGCAASPAATGEVVLNSDEYVALYTEMIADFPEEMPEGLEFPLEPPSMSGDIGAGNSGAMAYFFWSCAWTDTFLTSDDLSLRETAMAQLRRYPDTEWAMNHWQDPEGLWDRSLDAAQLGDPSGLREVYGTSCDFYRSSTGR